LASPGIRRAALGMAPLIASEAEPISLIATILMQVKALALYI
jgi:hypothetical protein